MEAYFTKELIAIYFIVIWTVAMLIAIFVKTKIRKPALQVIKEFEARVKKIDKEQR